MQYSAWRYATHLTVLIKVHTILKPTSKQQIKEWVTVFYEGSAEKISEFNQIDMICIMEHIFEDHEWGILEWKYLLGLHGCGFSYVENKKIKFQRGRWDKLSFLRLYELLIPV